MRSECLFISICLYSQQSAFTGRAPTNPLDNPVSNIRVADPDPYQDFSGSSPEFFWIRFSSYLYHYNDPEINPPL